jgi:GNAT superfamily N-acetyltransferase
VSRTVISRAGDGDLSDLVGLRYRWRVEEAGERGRSLEEFEVAFRAWLEAHRASHLAFVARDEEERALGCAWLCLVDRVPGPETFLRRGGMVQSVYVEPEHRNRGVGQQLVAALIAEARTMSLGYLVVHPSTRSFPFYRRLGFQDADRALEIRFDA